MMRLFCLVVSSLFLFACTSEEKASSASEYSESLDVKYARGFTINKTENGYFIEVRNPQDTSEILGEYKLSRTDTNEALAIPMEEFVLNSTTFGAYFDHLKVIDRIEGMTYTDRVMNEKIRTRIEDGDIKEVISGDGVDFETMLQINPDAVLAYRFGEANFDKYEEVGIPVILLMEYKESHPLARAEWIKVVGCLTGKESEADSIFTEVESAYVETRNQAMLHSSLPSAFTGSKYGDFWYAPGRDSYIAKYIRDAGARYAFEHIEGQESAELDFESALENISQADYWGMLVAHDDEFTKEDVKEMNPLYTNLRSFQEDQIFVCNTSEKDYFGDAIMEPHLILSDLYQIFHGRESESYTYHYFNPIP